MIRPSWMNKDVFQGLQERERSQAEDLKALEELLHDSGDGNNDGIKRGDDGRHDDLPGGKLAAGAMVPNTAQQPLSRVVTLRNVFNPKRLIRNQYLSLADEDQNEDQGGSTAWDNSSAAQAAELAAGEEQSCLGRYGVVMEGPGEDPEREPSGERAKRTARNAAKARDFKARRVAQERERREAAARLGLNYHAFADVEADLVRLCCQFGFVRYAQIAIHEDFMERGAARNVTGAAAQQRGSSSSSSCAPAAAVPPETCCYARVGFATKEAAKACIDALHGVPARWIRSGSSSSSGSSSDGSTNPLAVGAGCAASPVVVVVADYDVADAAACERLAVSRAVWIGNVFDPRQHVDDVAGRLIHTRGGGGSGGGALKKRRGPLASSSEVGAAAAAAASFVNFFDQLESDFVCECSRFGPIAPRRSSKAAATLGSTGGGGGGGGDSEEEGGEDAPWRVTACPLEGAIHVVFESIVSATDCLEAMNGRWFDERQMWAEFDLEMVSQDDYDVDQRDCGGSGDSDVNESANRRRASVAGTEEAVIRTSSSVGEDSGTRMLSAPCKVPDWRPDAHPPLFSLPVVTAGSLAPSSAPSKPPQQAAEAPLLVPHPAAPATSPAAPSVLMGLVDYDSE